MKSELELYSTTDLIEELIHRSTFQGIILRAKDEFRGLSKDEQVYRVTWNRNLSHEEVLVVLHDALEQLRNRKIGEE